MRDSTRREALIWLFGAKKAVRVYYSEAQKAQKGEHPDIDPSDIDEINWNPSFGELRAARTLKPLVDGVKLVCKVCGKKFQDERTVREKFLQETVGMPGVFYCPRDWKRMTRR